MIISLKMPATNVKLGTVYILHYILNTDKILQVQRSCTS